MENKNICKLKTIWIIPHIKAAIIIFGVAIVTLIISGILYLINSCFWSSVFANVFAGLITGLIICIIGGIKQNPLLILTLKYRCSKNCLR